MVVTVAQMEERWTAAERAAADAFVQATRRLGRTGTIEVRRDKDGQWHYFQVKREPIVSSVLS